MQRKKAQKKPAKSRDSNDLTTVARQLERIARLLAVLAIKGDNQTSQISVLNAAGYLPEEIAEVVGTTPNTVSVTLSRFKSGKKKKKKPRKDGD